MLAATSTSPGCEFGPDYSAPGPVCNRKRRRPTESGDRPRPAPVTRGRASSIEARRLGPISSSCLEPLLMSADPSLIDRLERLASALERMAPPAAPAIDFETAEAFVWQAAPEAFIPVPHVNRQPLGLLKGIERASDQLLDNTPPLRRRALGQQRAALGRPRHGQIEPRQGGPRSGEQRSPRPHSSRSIQGAIRHALEAGRDPPRGHRHHAALPRATCAARRHRFIVFCDDLSFDKDDTSYKSLKAVLEGGIEGRPGERDLLRHLQPPPPDAARHDGQRARDRHQPRRGGRGEGVAVGPVRALARLPQRQPGPVPRDDPRLCRPPQHQARRRRSWSARRSNGASRAAGAPAASPGSSSRISRAVWVCD